MTPGTANLGRIDWGTASDQPQIFGDWTLESRPTTDIGRTLQAAVRERKLLTVRLEQKELSLEECSEIFNYGERCIKELHLISNGLGASSQATECIAVLLLNSTILTSVTLGKNGLFGRIGAQITSVVYPGNSLRTLSLPENQMTDAEIIALAKRLQTTAPNLTKLDLRGNQISNGGAEALALLIKRPTTSLTALDLAANRIRAAGAAALCKALEMTNTTLRSLILSDNPVSERIKPGRKVEYGPDPDAWSCFGSMLENNRFLFELGLSRVGLNGEGITALRLQTNPTLATIDLAGNKLEDDGEALLSALEGNTGLFQVNVAYNCIDQQAQEKLEDDVANFVCLNAHLYKNQKMSLRQLGAACMISATFEKRILKKKTKPRLM